MGNKYYTPDGFNDQFPGICGFKRELESKLRNLFLLNGYEEIETPGVEYFDVYKEFVPEENLYKFGEQIGLAFQLQDDLLDVYGDPQVFGKNIGGDITSNKKTYMLINALNLANEAQRKELQKWIAAKDFNRKEKVAAVTRLYDEIGIRELCERKMDECYNRALDYLAKVDVPEERKKILKAYAEELLTRQS